MYVLTLTSEVKHELANENFKTKSLKSCEYVIEPKVSDLFHVVVLDNIYCHSGPIVHQVYILIKCTIQTCMCDALQQNREQVTQAYFEIWAIEVGIGVKNYSSVDFEIFDFLHTLICFTSPPCKFWLIFKHFPAKNCTFSAACHIKNDRNRKL